MEIIDNVGLHRRGESFPHNPVLESLIDKIKDLSNSPHVARLTLERSVAGKTLFMLSNNQNKTSVAVLPDSDGFTVVLHERALPDPELGFKPPVVRVKERSFASHDLQEAADFAVKHLDKDTPYSLNTVVRIKVTPTANPLEAWTFAGGRITTMQTDDAGVHLTVEDGKQTYFIPHGRLQGASNRPAVFKCVLFNENGDFEFLGSGDFDTYFVMKNVS